MKRLFGAIAGGVSMSLLCVSLLCMSLLCVSGLSHEVNAAPREQPAWARAMTPAGGEAKAIGSYAGGCIQGARALPERGTGFRSIRRHRNRYYGHPELIDFLQKFGERVAAAELEDVEIGDLSQPRGGLMSFGHRSHQVGLDADLWFGASERYRRGEERRRQRALEQRAEGEEPSQRERFNVRNPSTLQHGRERIDPKVWSDRHRQFLRWAAEDERVARIFVNWVIKAQLCRERQRSTGEAAAESEWGWLRKIRPWYGHDQHFHVRLRCPSGSEHCQNQGALPPGDSCGKERWFSYASLRRRKAATARAAEERAAARAAMSPRERRRARAADRRKAEAKAAAKRRRTEPINRRCAALTDPPPAGEAK